MADIKKCDQENCTVNKDGKCLEGFEDLDQCPHFYLDDATGDDEGEAAGKTPDGPNKSSFKLFDGEELSLEKLTDLTYRYPAKKIYILGEHDSGKTTLLATLFEMFQVGPFHGHHYAGSMTQIGFERRCFYSRIASGNETPDTERTKSEDFRFLHISMKEDPATQIAIHFLISDISGEKIKRAKNNSEDMKDLQIIADSSHVSFVIDGEKLVDAKTRQASLIQAKTFIKKAIDEGVFNKQTRLTILLSKWDLLYNITNFDYLGLIENSFQRDFAMSLKEINFLKIAVRPDTFNEGFKLGHGLIDLIRLWLPVNTVQSNEIELETSVRMIDNFNFQ